MAFDPDTSALIGRIYDAVIEGHGDDGAWDEALSALAAAMGSSGAAFVMHDPRQDGVTRLVHWNYASQAAEEYTRYYRSVDIWLERGRAFSAPGNVEIGTRLVPRAELARTEYFNDYLRRWDMGDFLSVTAANDRDRFGYLVLYRPIGGDDYAADQIRWMAGLRQHVVRAMRMQTELERERHRGTDLAGLLDRLAAGIFVLDDAGRVIFANASGERLVAEADGLGIEQSRLVPADPAARSLFEGAVAAAASPGRSVMLTRPSGRAAYRADIVPLQPGRFEEGWRQRGAVLVWIDDPERGLAVSEQRLRQLYRLGPGEARLVLDLAMGKRLSEIADDRGIARSTLKTQLERIYAKTGVHRQGDLARLWAGLAQVADPADE